MPSLLPVDDDLLLDEDESGIGSDRGRSSDGGSLGAGSGSNFLLLNQRHTAYIVRLSRGIDSASVVDGRGRMAAAVVRRRPRRRTRRGAHLQLIAIPHLCAPNSRLTTNNRQIL